MSKSFLEWVIPEYLRLIGIVILGCSSPLWSALCIQRFEGPTVLPRLMRGGKQLGKSADLCCGAGGVSVRVLHWRH